MWDKALPGPGVEQACRVSADCPAQSCGSAHLLRSLWKPKYLFMVAFSASACAMWVSEREKSNTAREREGDKAENRKDYGRHGSDCYCCLSSMSMDSICQASIRGADSVVLGGVTTTTRLQHHWN